MKILVAPNSMKGSLDAFRFADAVEKAFLQSGDFEVKKLPVADGGDFTGPVLQSAMDAKIISLVANDPLGRSLKTSYGISGETAIIEMADISGMRLLINKELNPLKATSYGTGELVLDAVKKGCTKILMGVGGSATVDGGVGMMSALGLKLFDENGAELEASAKSLPLIKSLDFKPNFTDKVKVIIVSDVDNPLLGENGAAHVFAPQKGADNEMIEFLEEGLRNWSQVVKEATGRNISELPGAGAAGGIGTGLIAFLNAQIVQGADFILDTVGFDEAAQWSDLVITGEGKIDGQTLNNKAPFAVSKRSRKFRKPVYAIGGICTEEATKIFDKVYAVKNDSMTLEYAIKNAEALVFQTAKKMAGELK